MKPSAQALKTNLAQFLNRIYDDFHHQDFLSSDPIEFVYEYTDFWDQEAIALLAALLAYGKVAQIRNALRDAVTRIHQLSPSPADFVRNLSRPQFSKKAEKVFNGFVHRFNTHQDILLLFKLLNRSWKKYGSLGSHFDQYLAPTDPDIGNALSLLIQDWKRELSDRTPTSFFYLLTSPQDGSCCKRWCMFLRWMGRKDQVDPGLWTGRTQLRAHQLVMPLDTHTGRISQYLGLTSRKSLGWKAALEVTQALKNVDPQDPTRYDFALSRLGILEICQRNYREEICKKCQLLPVCQFAQKKGSSSALVSMQRSV